MNKRIKKKKLKQWIKNNVKITYSFERLDNGNCKLYARIKEKLGKAVKNGVFYW